MVTYANFTGNMTVSLFLALESLIGRKKAQKQLLTGATNRPGGEQDGIHRTF